MKYCFQIAALFTCLMCMAGEKPPKGVSKHDLKLAQKEYRHALELQKKGQTQEAFEAAGRAAELVPGDPQFITAREMLRGQLAARPDAAPGPGEGEAAAQGAAASGTVGAIRSRQDAIRALDAVTTFFENTEPSSPVPMFVERAKRLIAKNFLDVVQDIVPDALNAAKAAGGIREKQ